MRRVAFAIPSVLLATSGLALAAPAQAAQVDVNLGACSGSTFPLTPTGSLTTAVGDTIRVILNASGPSITVSLTGASGATSVTSFGTFSWTTTAASGSIVFTQGGCSATITFSATGGGSSSSTGSDSSPPPVIQQFGLPSSGTCDAAAPNELNWSGVASGGWAESWAQWMNGGLGGAVCTRDLVYSTGTGSWGVAQ
jgi:hypothetical protein